MDGLEGYLFRTIHPRKGLRVKSLLIASTIVPVQQRSAYLRFQTVHSESWLKLMGSTVVTARSEIVGSPLPARTTSEILARDDRATIGLLSVIPSNQPGTITPEDSDCWIGSLRLILSLGANELCQVSILAWASRLMYHLRHLDQLELAEQLEKYNDIFSNLDILGHNFQEIVDIVTQVELEGLGDTIGEVSVQLAQAIIDQIYYQRIACSEYVAELNPEDQQRLFLQDCESTKCRSPAPIRPNQQGRSHFSDENEVIRRVSYGTSHLSIGTDDRSCRGRVAHSDPETHQQVSDILPFIGVPGITQMISGQGDDFWVLTENDRATYVAKVTHGADVAFMSCTSPMLGLGAAPELPYHFASLVQDSPNPALLLVELGEHHLRLRMLVMIEGELLIDELKGIIEFEGDTHVVDGFSESVHQTDTLGGKRVVILLGVTYPHNLKQITLLQVNLKSSNVTMMSQENVLTSNLHHFTWARWKKLKSGLFALYIANTGELMVSRVPSDGPAEAWSNYKLPHSGLFMRPHVARATSAIDLVTVRSTTLNGQLFQVFSLYRVLLTVKRSPPSAAIASN